MLAYYAIANASAITLTVQEGRPPCVVPVVARAGCAVLAFSLPVISVVSGAAVLGLGVAWYGLRRATVRRHIAGDLRNHGGKGPARAASGDAPASPRAPRSRAAARDIGL